jgi:hypothetical protein
MVILIVVSFLCSNHKLHDGDIPRITVVKTRVVPRSFVFQKPSVAGGPLAQSFKHVRAGFSGEAIDDNGNSPRSF